MREPLKYLLGWLAVVVVLLFCFSRLCLNPDSILVDPDRPSIDRAIRGKPRGVGNDLTSYHLPRLLWVQRSIFEEGRLSFWDPSGFGGRPRLGNPQAGMFYPFAWPVLFWKSASLPGWLTVGHLALGGFGLFCLAKCSRMSSFAATVAGISYAANPYMLGQVFEGHYPHVWSACWYPWAFLAWKKASRGSGFSLLMLSMILALSLTTGHPQEWYYLAIAMGGLAIFDRVADKPRLRLGPLMESSGLYLGAVALCLGLCAVEILPDALAQEWTLKPSGVNLRGSLSYNVQLTNILQWFHPFALGSPDRYFGRGNYWETQLSVGFIPLFFLCVGIVQTNRRPDLIRWFLLGLACLMFAAGPKLGVYEIFYRILPGMDRFRVASRTLFLANVAWAMLLAAGIDAIRDGRSSLLKRGAIRSFFLGSIGMILGVGLLVAMNQQGVESLLLRNDRRSNSFLLALTDIFFEPTFWIPFFSVLLLIAVPWKSGFFTKNRGLILGFLAIFEIAAHAQELLKTAPPSRFLGDATTNAIFPEWIVDTSDGYRLAAVDSAFSDVRAARLGLEKTNVNDLYQIQNASLLYEKLYDFLDPRHPPGWGTQAMDQPAIEHKAEIAQAVLDRMSVKWIVTEEALTLSGLEPSKTSREASGSFSVATNRDPLPRAYVVPRSLNANGRLDPSINWLRDVSAREFVRLEVADPLPEGPRQSFRKAEYHSVNPDHVVVNVETKAPGFLVVTNTWDPGWTATVDGNPSPVLRGNLAQQVVALPKAGNHRIELHFRPRGLFEGLLISSISLAVWIGLLIRCALQEFRPTRDAFGATTPGSKTS